MRHGAASRDSCCPCWWRCCAADGQTISRRLRAQRRGAAGTRRDWSSTRAGSPCPARSSLPPPVTEIVENGVRYAVDVENGQKTGFFLDQKYNRQAVARLAQGRTGAGLLHPHRLLCPQRRPGRRRARDGGGCVARRRWPWPGRTPGRNGLAGRDGLPWRRMCSTCCPRWRRSPSVYDFIILDPPAFTKSRSTVPKRHAAATRRSTTGP